MHDNAGNPAQAVSDVRTYAHQGIKLVVGGAFGPDCVAQTPVVGQSDLIAFCGSTDNLDPPAPPHMFGVGLAYTPTIAAYAKVIARYSKKPAVFADKDKSGDESAHYGPLLKAAGTDSILIRTSTRRLVQGLHPERDLAGSRPGSGSPSARAAAISAVATRRLSASAARSTSRTASPPSASRRL